MDDLEDELDLRFHRGLDPDVYYRCPTLEVLAFVTCALTATKLHTVSGWCLAQ